MVQVKLNLIVITFLMPPQSPKHQLKRVKDVRDQEKKMIDKILLIIILAPIILLAWLWYQDKKRQVELLSDRLHNLENNVTRLNNERR